MLIAEILFRFFIHDLIMSSNMIFVLVLAFVSVYAQTHAPTKKPSLFVSPKGIVPLVIIVIYWVLAIPGCIFIYIKYVKEKTGSHDKKKGVNLKVKLRKKHEKHEEEYDEM
ncbi:hypothetical protein M3Y98_00645200 [Aphelenchoides besseyi]|nr:hypothetical protein M3Y98_00645200 [Aphelenchoides besseyi]KAI6208614.1 hypothetical protein M3Y96_00133700 [Aphelenchoides besseyi]